MHPPLCAERGTLETYGVPDASAIPIGMLHSDNLEGPDADESNDYLVMVNKLVEEGPNKGPQCAAPGKQDGYKDLLAAIANFPPAAPAAAAAAEAKK